MRSDVGFKSQLVPTGTSSLTIEMDLIGGGRLKFIDIRVGNTDPRTTGVPNRFCNVITRPKDALTQRQIHIVTGWFRYAFINGLNFPLRKELDLLIPNDYSGSIFIQVENREGAGDFQVDITILWELKK